MPANAVEKRAKNKDNLIYSRLILCTTTNLSLFGAINKMVDLIGFCGVLEEVIV